MKMADYFLLLNHRKLVNLWNYNFPGVNPENLFLPAPTKYNISITRHAEGAWGRCEGWVQDGWNEGDTPKPTSNHAAWIYSISTESGGPLSSLTDPGSLFTITTQYPYPLWLGWAPKPVAPFRLLPTGVCTIITDQPDGFIHSGLCDLIPRYFNNAAQFLGERINFNTLDAPHWLFNKSTTAANDYLSQIISTYNTSTYYKLNIKLIGGVLCWVSYVLNSRVTAVKS